MAMTVTCILKMPCPDELKHWVEIMHIWPTNTALHALHTLSVGIFPYSLHAAGLTILSQWVENLDQDGLTWVVALALMREESRTLWRGWNLFIFYFFFFSSKSCQCVAFQNQTISFHVWDSTVLKGVRSLTQRLSIPLAQFGSKNAAINALARQIISTWA